MLPDWRPEVDSSRTMATAMLVRARIYATPPGGAVPMEQVMWQVIQPPRTSWLRWDFFRTEEEARAALSDD